MHIAAASAALQASGSASALPARQSVPVKSGQTAGARATAQRAPLTRHADLTTRAVQVLGTWCCFCSLYIVSTARQLGIVESGILWTFWQPFIPPLLMLWLWGHAVKRMEQRGVEYQQCFPMKDRKFCIDGAEIQRVALILYSIVATCGALFCALVKQQLFVTAEFLPFITYSCVGAVALLPLAVLHRATREFFVRTALRVLMPFQEVSWADFLLADIFCSLSKSTADVTNALCQAATSPVMQSLTHPQYTLSSLCGPTSTLMLFAPCLPYLIRFIQCLIVNYTTDSRTQLFNAAKYMSAFPALMLTVLEHESVMKRQTFPHRSLWLTAMVFNTVYSYYWDVEMDWDMPWIYSWTKRTTSNARKPGSLRSWLPCLRQDAMYSPAFYSWALVSNLILRCAWTHRLIQGLERHRRIGLILACAEVFRRYQWSFIRIETELRKISLRHHSAITLDQLSQSVTQYTQEPTSGIIHNPVFGVVPQALNAQNDVRHIQQTTLGHIGITAGSPSPRKTTSSIDSVIDTTAIR